MKQEKHRQWWQKAVFYQIYPRSFADGNGDGLGDILGIRRHIDYLQSLGIDAVWMTPVCKTPDRDHGYDISDYYDIDPRFGSLDELNLLVEDLHRAGIKLIIDIVVNHTSDQHPWFQKSAADPTGTYRDFYIWRKGRGDGPPNNWNSFFGGSAWTYHPGRGEYFLSIFSRHQPDLNWENPMVREEVYRMMRWWRDRGADGFRLDVINMISKDQRFPDDERELPSIATKGTPYFVNGPRLEEYLKEMRRETVGGTDTVLIGECPGIDLETTQRLSRLNGEALDMILPMELMEIDHGPGGKWDIRNFDGAQVGDILERWQRGLIGEAWPANFFSNHDQPRALSRFGENRFRRESGKMLCLILMTLSGTPFIYMGEELGMTNADYKSLGDYRDIDSLQYYELRREEGVEPAKILATLRYMSRDNARAPLRWKDGDSPGFSEVAPWIPYGNGAEAANVESEERDPDSVLNFYKQCIALRKGIDAFGRGDFERLPVADRELFLYFKTRDKERLLIAANFSESCKQIEASLDIDGIELLISSYPERGNQFELRPYEAKVFRLPRE